MSVSEAELRYRRELLDCFAYAVTVGHVPAFVEQLGDLNWPSAWHDAFREIVRLGDVHPSIRTNFAKIWFGTFTDHPVRPPGGAQMRGMFSDDIDLLVNALRILLPPSVGNAPTVLYRGQSKEEFDQGITGFSWSQSALIAEAYARSPFNTKPRIIVATFAPDDAIIGQPAESELVLDPRRLAGRIHLIHAPVRLFHEGEMSHPATRFEMEVLDRLALIQPESMRVTA